MTARTRSSYPSRTTPAILRTLLLVLATLAVLMPAPASAQGYIAPFVGYNFGGDAQCPEITDCEEKNLNFGIGLGHLGVLFGFEQEFAYAKDFFGEAPDFESSVLTVMSNAVISPRLRPIRPYFLVGLGLIKTNVDLNATSLLSNDGNSLGWNIGGGVLIGGRHVALRGDIRFFHAFDDFEIAGIGIDNTNLDFGRASAGLFIGW